MQWLLSKNETSSLDKRVQLLYWNVSSSIFITMAAFTAMCILQLGNAPFLAILLFFTIMLIVCTLRFLDAKHKPIDTYDFSNSPNKDFKRFTTGVLATGAIFGSFNLAFVHASTLLELSLNAIILAALVGGAMTVLGAVRRLVIAYAGLLLIPACLGSLFVDIDDFKLISILGLGYWLITFKAANLNSEFVHKTLSLVDENERLLSELKNEKDLLFQTNEELINAKEELAEHNLSLESKIRKRTDQIMRLSNLDALTMLYNRKVIQHEIDAALSASNTGFQCAVLFIDLDGFKEINDQLGHSQGDEVLRSVAARLDSIRKSLSPNIVLGRWGGDEFIILAKNYTPKAILGLSLEIRRALSSSLKVGDDSLTLSCSMGASFYPEHAHTSEKLIQFADSAMYACKQSTDISCFVFNDDLQQKLEREQSLKLGLSKAIANDEFHLVYQPIVSGINDDIVGLEVLIRWRYQGQLISPVEFIPIAEKSELIVDIGQWVLQEACVEFLSLDLPKHCYLSVNVSAIQIKQPDFVNQIRSVLKQNQLQGKRLQLELTESLILEEKAQANEVFKALHDTGVRIAIDDFGTGYSSLKQLQDVAFDAIKIDRSFIVNLSQKDRAILTAAHFIAEQMDATTIVEGIETEYQHNQLKELGFSNFQGFYFAKPMEKDALLSWHSTHRKTPAQL